MCVYIAMCDRRGGYVVVCGGVGWAFECVVDGIVHPTHQLHAVTQKLC